MTIVRVVCPVPGLHLRNWEAVPQPEYVDRVSRELRRTLEKPTFDASWATYVLVQVRKIVEHHRESDKTRYAVLNLFCNWGLHIRIDRDPKNVHLFFQAFDIRDGMEIQDWLRSQYFEEFVLLRSFRSALDSFLEDHSLPDWLTKITDDWLQFVYLYAGVVGAAPLLDTKDGILPSEVTQLRMDRTKAENMAQEHVRVRVVLKDGKDYYSMHILPLRDFSAEWVYRYQRPRFPR